MKKVLIISTNAIGDTYISLSCIKPLNDYFQDVEYTTICMKESSFLPPLFNVRNVLQIVKKDIFNIIKLYRLLRDSEFDYCFSFFPGRMNSLLTILSKSKEKYYYRNFTKLIDWYNLSQFVYINKFKTNISWNPNLTYIDRVRLILDIVIKKEYVLEKARFISRKSVLLFNDKYVVINFSSKEKQRELNIEFINEVSLFLFKEYNLQIVIIDFQDKCKKIDHSYTSVYNNKDLYCTLDLLLNSVFVITVDSFLIHIIDAYQIPSLCIFGPTNPQSVINNYRNLKVFRKLPIEDISLSEILIHFNDLIN